MWSANIEELHTRCGLRYSVTHDSRPATFAEAVQAWQTDLGFREHFNTLLAGAPYSAFRWETPPITAATLTRPFEFVVLNDPGLARQPDPCAFAEYFAGARNNVAVFRNLGKDAIMIVPCPVA